MSEIQKIEIGDIVLTKIVRHFEVKKGKVVSYDFPRMSLGIAEVRNICDHYSETNGMHYYEGTSVRLSNGDQLPISFCKPIIRPFKKEVTQ